MFKVGQTVKIVGNKYPTNNRHVPMDECRSGHEFNIGDIGVITQYDKNDELQPYNVFIEGKRHSWVATSDIEEVKWHKKHRKTHPSTHRQILRNRKPLRLNGLVKTKTGRIVHLGVLMGRLDYGKV